MIFVSFVGSCFLVFFSGLQISNLEYKTCFKCISIPVPPKSEPSERPSTVFRMKSKLIKTCKAACHLLLFFLQPQPMPSFPYFSIYISKNYLCGYYMQNIHNHSREKWVSQKTKAEKIWELDNMRIIGKWGGRKTGSMWYQWARCKEYFCKGKLIEDRWCPLDWITWVSLMTLIRAVFLWGKGRG